MIRKQTTVLIGIFAALLGLTFYLQKNPIAASNADVTPSATALPAMLPGWTSTDITTMELKDNQAGTTTRLTADAQGNWTEVGEGKAVSLGKVEMIRSEIVNTQAMAALSGSYALDALELSQPAYVLALTNAQGKQSEIHIGKVTPTGSGYYVQVDGQAPVVASKTAVETILDGFKPEKLFDYTPTPVVTTPAETTAPGSSAADATPQPGSPTATGQP